MNAKPLFWLPAAVLVFSTTNAVFGQAVSTLPRAEYYVARELFGAAQTLTAAEGFETALSRARRVGQKRWIDSVPPLVMLGECYYRQGNIAAALEQYDAALLLYLENSAWIDQVETVAEPVSERDAAKGINWFPRSRPIQLLAIPEGVQIAIDPTQAQVGPQGGVVAPVSLVTRLDAAEVLQTTGIALMRRWQLLGPLAKHSPLAEPLGQLFSQNPRTQAPWILSSWSVLRGISELARADGAAGGVGDIRKGLMVANQFDYFLSPLALYVLAQVDIENGNYRAALQTLQEASLIAGHFEQHGTLADAMAELASCAVASRRGDMIEPLQAFSSWAGGRSLAAHTAGLVGAMELAIYSGDVVQAEKIATQAAAVLGRRDVVLPRRRARFAYCNSLAAYSKNQGVRGRNALFESLKAMQGSAATGAVVPRVFQTQMVLDLLAGGALTKTVAEEILIKLVAEPTPIQWQSRPLETLAAITTSSLPAYERRLELAVNRGATVQEQIPLINRLQQQRLFEALPLGGRLLAWRSAINANPQSLAPLNRKSVELARQAYPEIEITLSGIGDLLGKLQAEPLPLDDRDLTASAKKQIADLTEMSESHENQLALLSLMRYPMDRLYPSPASLDGLQAQAREGDIVIGFATTAQFVFGVAVTKDDSHVWSLNSTKSINTLLKEFVSGIGLVRNQGHPLPSEVTAANAKWQDSTKTLYTMLFPEEVRKLLVSSKRIVLAPNDQLWYAPFELFPDGPAAGARLWIANHRITYIPTLGSIARVTTPKTLVRETVGIVGGAFFSPDKEANRLQVRKLVDGIPDSHLIALNQKITVPSAQWLRLRTDRLWVAHDVDTSQAGWEAIAIGLGASRQDSFANWTKTPRRSPPEVIYAGMASSMRTGKLGNGNDVFLPAAAIALGGGSGVIARWPGRGPSAANLMLRYMEEQQDEPASEALRRAVIAQWSEDYLIADEPSLLPAGSQQDALCSGRHPLLWSGYMTVGDNN